MHKYRWSSGQNDFLWLTLLILIHSRQLGHNLARVWHIRLEISSCTSATLSRLLSFNYLSRHISLWYMVITINCCLCLPATLAKSRGTFSNIGAMDSFAPKSEVSEFSVKPRFNFGFFNLGWVSQNIHSLLALGFWVIMMTHLVQVWSLLKKIIFAFITIKQAKSLHI